MNNQQREAAALNNRKEEHIDAILRDESIDRQGNFFNRIHLMHRAFPEMALADVDTSIRFLNRTLSFPFMISSMSGGGKTRITQLNQNLAIAAQEAGVAMSVGSQRVQIRDSEAQASFKLRHLAPDVPLIANMGAVQLNYGYGLDEAQAMVDTLEADALYLHLNPLQESIQPEGNTNFSGLAEKIAQLREKLGVPIILKEVGAGLSPQDIQLGLDAGVTLFDLSGRGGTSWSRVENHRNEDHQNGLVFQDWGIPTPIALKMAQPFMQAASFIVSGGVRSGIDMVKSIIMGGDLCGVAKPLLVPGLTASQDCIEAINTYKTQFATGLFLLGMPNVTTAKLNQELILHDGCWY